MAQNELNARENLLLAARMTHNNEIIDVAEVLNETNDIIQDAHVERGNDITSHVVSRRSALPTVSWVKVGNGWSATTGLVNQARETIGMMKARYKCPEDVMRLQPNPAKYRSQQERAYIESMGQEFANTVIAGTVAGVPEEFDGVATRYTTIAAGSVFNNGATAGTGATTSSMWFFQWGPGKVYLIYPRNGSGGGIRKNDLGLVNTTGDNSLEMRAYETEFHWDVGLCIEDTRSVKRLCNISTLSSTDVNTLDEDKIIQIRNNYKTAGTIYAYCNEDVYTQLQILAKDKMNVHWGPENPFGAPQLYFLDMPIRRCDAITSTQSILT